LFRTTEIVKSSSVSSDERGGMDSHGSYISIDGSRIQRLSLRAVRKHLAIIPQEPFLFR
jgi:ABC-type transport system involved in cytochrome bd biosynthesis fused ATPase/permease subunit